MAAVLAVTGPSFGRLASGAHSFRQHYRELKNSNVSTVERLVFSLVLAHTKTPKAAAAASDIPRW